MKKLLSVLMAIAMLVMSMTAFAEAPAEDALLNGSLTLSNVFFTVGDEMIDLTDLAARIGFAQENEGECLIDLGLLYKGEDQLNAQLFCAEDGSASLRFGEGGVYTFSGAFMEELAATMQELAEMTFIDLDEEETEETEAEAPAIEMPSEEAMMEWVTNLSEKVLPLVEDATVTETTVEIDGAEIPASEITFDITMQQAFELGKEVISTFPVEGAASLLEGVEYDAEEMGEGTIAYDIIATEDGSYVSEAIGVEYGDEIAVVNLELVNGEVNLAMSIEDFLLTLTLTVDETPVADNISGIAPEKVFDSMETLLNEGDGFLASLFGMVGDLEPLMNDENVAAFVNLFTGTYDDFDDYEYEYDYDDLSCSPEEMPFTMPVIGYVVDGYTLDSESYMDYQDGTGYAYLEYVNEVGDFYSLSFSNYESEYFYYELTDEGLVAVENTMANCVTATGDPAYNYGMSINGVDVNLAAYGAQLTLEDAAAILGGLS